MLTASRRLTVLQCRNRLFPSIRCIYSGRAPHLLSQTSFEGSSSEETKKEGYGEKEISLLGPRDIRTPLPGNMGIPPLSMLYTAKIKQLPKPAGDDCEVTQGLLPEERYQNLLNQAADASVESDDTLSWSISNTATSSSLSVNIKIALVSLKKLECQAHICPQLLKKDFLDLFPNRDLGSNDLTVITISQKTENDMSTWSESAETERESLEKYFITVANVWCEHLKQFQYWADFIHPNSGKPHLDSLTNATMFETDERYRHFGFNIEDLGCCRIISHRVWGPNVFVGAIFTNARPESVEIQEILSGKNSNHSIIIH